VTVLVANSQRAFTIANIGCGFVKVSFALLDATNGDLMLQLASPLQPIACVSFLPLYFQTANSKPRLRSLLFTPPSDSCHTTHHWHPCHCICVCMHSPALAGTDLVAPVRSSYVAGAGWGESAARFAASRAASSDKEDRDRMFGEVIDGLARNHVAYSELRIGLKNLPTKRE
jgi:hypothetical protein